MRVTRETPMRRLVYALVAIFLCLVALLVIRGLTFGSGGGTAQESSTPDVNAVEALAAARRLGEAITFRTVTRASGEPAKGDAGPWLAFHDWLETTYPHAHEAMTRETLAGYTLLYRWAGRDAALDPVVYMAHQDVVPVDPATEDLWDAPPFAGNIVDGHVVGRGALDDKGSLIGLMEAAEALAADGFTPQRTIYFLFGHDEEVGGDGAQAGFAHLAAQGIRAEMVLDEGMVSMEKMPLTGKDVSMIGIAEKGYVSVEIIATGAGGHSSTPPRDSAAIRLSRAVVALEDHQLPAHFSSPTVKGYFAAIGRDMDFLARLAMANRWLFSGMLESQFAAIPAANAMIRTTTAPTMLEGASKENILPQRARAVVNFRIHPSDSVQSVIEHVERVTDGIDGLEIHPLTGDGIASEPSGVSRTDNRAYAALAAAAREVAPGAPVAPTLVLGATDSRFAGEVSDNIYRYVPIKVTYEALDGIHGSNERISVENVGRMITAYQQIILMMDMAP